MYDIIRDWYARNFSDPQAVILALLLLVAFGLVWLGGGLIGPNGRGAGWGRGLVSGGGGFFKKKKTRPPTVTENTKKR